MISPFRYPTARREGMRDTDEAAARRRQPQAGTGRWNSTTRVQAILDHPRWGAREKIRRIAVHLFRVEAGDVGEMGANSAGPYSSLVPRRGRTVTPP